MKVIENQTFDMERALYGSENVLVQNCSFDGPADGESAFKEGRNIETATFFPGVRMIRQGNPYGRYHGGQRVFYDAVRRSDIPWRGV